MLVLLNIIYFPRLSIGSFGAIFDITGNLSSRFDLIHSPILAEKNAATSWRRKKPCCVASHDGLEPADSILDAITATKLKKA